MNRKSIIINSNDNSLSATFLPEKGGICSSLKYSANNKTRELLYLHDFFQQEEWHDLPGGWPFLFPVCARVERNGKQGIYLYEGNLCEMPMHGFAWRMPWEVVAVKSNQLHMRFTNNAQTYKIYPFKFELELIYTVSANLFQCEQIYRNLSDQPMPYYAGFHPYFLTLPPDKGKEKILLDYQPIKKFIYNENFTDLCGEQAVFKTPISIMDPALNEQLTKVGENKLVKLKFPDGFFLEMHAQGIKNSDLFSYIQLYTMPDKPFFCVEPWMSFPNAINTVKGVQWLAAGDTQRALLTLAMHE